MLLEKVKDFSFAVQPYYNNMAVTLQMFLDEMANELPFIDEDVTPFPPTDVGISPPPIQNELPITMQVDLGFLDHLTAPLLATQSLPISVPLMHAAFHAAFSPQPSALIQQASPSNPQISPPIQQNSTVNEQASPSNPHSPPIQQTSTLNQQASPSNPQISAPIQLLHMPHSSQSSAPIAGSINQLLTNILNSADDIMDQTLSVPPAAPISGTINQLLGDILNCADDIMDHTVTINQLWNEIEYSDDSSISMDEESISDSHSVSSFDVEESVIDLSSSISSDGESTVGSNVDDEVVLIMQFSEGKD